MGGAADLAERDRGRGEAGHGLSPYPLDARGARRPFVGRVRRNGRSADRRRRRRYKSLGRRPRGRRPLRAEPRSTPSCRAPTRWWTSSSRSIQAAGDAKSVGLGVPSVIDFKTGTARSSVNIPLRGVPLRELLGERLDMPVFVDNDATVAALAEAHDDDLNLIAQSLVMITVGTGVGGGIVIDGRIYRGAHRRRARARPHHRRRRPAQRRPRAAGQAAAPRLAGVPRRRQGAGPPRPRARHRRRPGGRGGRPGRRRRRAGVHAHPRRAPRRRHRQRRQRLRPRAGGHRRRRLAGRRPADDARARDGGRAHHRGRGHRDARSSWRATGRGPGVRGAALLAGQELDRDSLA